MGIRTLPLVIAGIGICGSSSALEFDFYDIDISWNNRVTLAGAVRVEERDESLIGKLNLNPSLCAGDDCLSLGGDPAPNQRLVDAPGAFFADKQDDGNLNYDQWDMTAGLAKITSDFTASWNDFTFKTRVIGFYDAINNNFDEYHPNNSDVVSPGVGGYQPAYTKRDGGVEELFGSDIYIQDLLLNGTFYFGDRLLSVSVGAQKARWGEANLIALNSLNEINSPDIRGLRQPGGQINEVFQPVPMLLLSGDLFPDQGISGEMFYQFGWKRVQADAGGTFFGELDALYREGQYSSAYINLGQFPEDQLVEDEDGRLRGEHRLQTPLGALLTDTSFTIPVDQNSGEPSDTGQYGVRLNWFADMINNGTEFSLYAMNYHSRLPYLSFFAADRNPLRDGPTGTAIDILTTCLPADVDCLPIDTAAGLVDYPEDIRMFGISFNTNIGSWSVAGEYSYRPNVPVQISMPDLIFVALQPAFPEEDLVIGAETLLGSGLGGTLDDIVGPVLAPILAPILGDGIPITVPGARTAVPDYAETIYRGSSDIDSVIAERGANYYIPGYERLKVGQFVINGIRILGSSNPIADFIGSEQIIMMIEGGFTHIVDMPSRELIQFDGSSPQRTHASPGSDGTGTPEGEEVNTGSFNPTQQTEAFVDDFAWGYRFLTTFEYNDVFWGVNLKPFIIGAHDVKGFAPAPQQNFLEDRIEVLFGTEWFKGQQWSGKLQYNLHAGSKHNIRRDKDNVVVELTYTF